MLRQKEEEGLDVREEEEEEEEEEEVVAGRVATKVQRVCDYEEPSIDEPPPRHPALGPFLNPEEARRGSEPASHSFTC
ncbi:hypothetical protein EYF80_044339 [Liparis tanakae]|uniref:Uncharacterized protein n=1 Tax=Liparis tanakae TaxID=230148 RepID=A0A4Z2FX30_9TELE|nr:hypothetical protein EYF80_044339 [Liparis tanakae]